MSTNKELEEKERAVSHCNHHLLNSIISMLFKSLPILCVWDLGYFRLTGFISPGA